MPKVMCENGHVSHWRNTRGSKKPTRCWECGAEVRRARYNYDADCYEYAQPRTGTNNDKDPMAADPREDLVENRWR